MKLNSKDTPFVFRQKGEKSVNGEGNVKSEFENSQLLGQSKTELKLLNFFDNFDDTTLKSPNDDERDPSNGDGNVMASSDVNSPPHVNDEATFATQLDENNNISEGSQTEVIGSRSGIELQSRVNNGDEPHTVRKSSRVSNIPLKFNDFILPSNKKYGIESMLIILNCLL
ncbi:hypothetical protein Tco_0683443 [Tanacetum coccineum]|uniref:Uncharacterized protein n=1 Tax=Tanacetum coccineum TaxID=301880 RepID=A0ABQ4XU01_9ASTR